MRRLLRILLNAATVLSLVLCVATVVFWLRSYWSYDRWGYDLMRRFPTGWEQRSYSVDIDSGRLRLMVSRLFFTDAYSGEIGMPPIRPYAAFSHTAGTPEGPAPHSSTGPDLVVTRGRFGFQYGVLNPTPRTRDYLHTVWLSGPLWPLVPCATLLPLLACRLRRRRIRARKLGRCLVCGYDLRATPDRCPECGNVPAALPPNAPARIPADRSG
jgi:hypothetical protein